MAEVTLTITGVLVAAQLVSVGFATKKVRELRTVFSHHTRGGLCAAPVSTYLKNFLPWIGLCWHTDVRTEFCAGAHLFLLLTELILAAASSMILTSLLQEAIELALIAGFVVASLNLFLLCVFWRVYFGAFKGSRKYETDLRPKLTFAMELFVVSICVGEFFAYCLAVSLEVKSVEFVTVLVWVLCELIFHLVLRLTLLVTLRVTGTLRWFALPAATPVTPKTFKHMLLTSVHENDPLEDERSCRKNGDVTFVGQNSTSRVEPGNTYEYEAYEVSLEDIKPVRKRQPLPEQWNIADTHLNFVVSGQITEHCREPLVHSEVMQEYEDLASVSAAPKPSAEVKLHPVLVTKKKKSRKNEVFEALPDSFVETPVKGVETPTKFVETPTKFVETPLKHEEPTDLSKQCLKVFPWNPQPHTNSKASEDSREPSKEPSLEPEGAASDKELSLSEVKDLTGMLEVSNWTEEEAHIESPAPTDGTRFRFDTLLLMDNPYEEFKEQPLTPTPVDSREFTFDGPPDHTAVYVADYEEPTPHHLGRVPPRNPLNSSSSNRRLPPMPHKQRLKKTAPIDYASPYLDPLPRLPREDASILQTGQSTNRSLSRSNSALGNSFKPPTKLSRVSSSSALTNLNDKS